jgi:hypothetical protein
MVYRSQQETQSRADAAVANFFQKKETEPVAPPAPIQPALQQALNVQEVQRLDVVNVATAIFSLLSPKEKSQLLTSWRTLEAMAARSAGFDTAGLTYRTMNMLELAENRRGAEEAAMVLLCGFLSDRRVNPWYAVSAIDVLRGVESVTEDPQQVAFWINVKVAIVEDLTERGIRKPPILE